MRKSFNRIYRVKIKIVLVALIFCLCVISRADQQSNTPQWELWTGSLADFTMSFSSSERSGNFLGNKAGLSPTIGYLLSDRVGVLLAPSFSFHSSGNYVGSIMAGLSINFAGSAQNRSFFAKALFGFDDIFDSKTSDVIHLTFRTFTWSASLGKRFELNSYFTFSPEITYKMVFESYSSISTLSFVPLQFSLLF